MSKAAYRLNQQIEAFVLEKEELKIPYTEADIAYVNQYIGYGGMWDLERDLQKERGLYEYYTPITVTEKMIGLVHKHGFKKGRIMEPSCGIGRFMHYFSPEADVMGIELDKISYLIAKANFPTFNILHQSFNSLFVDRRGNILNWRDSYEPFNLVIGNPPYGAFKGRNTATEKQLTKSTTYVDYFITRGLDLLVKGGLLAYIIPSSFIDGKSTKVKTEILRKADLVDAYRLPKSTFDQTDIQTDIVIFRKK